MNTPPLEDLNAVKYHPCVPAQVYTINPRVQAAYLALLLELFGKEVSVILVSKLLGLHQEIACMLLECAELLVLEHAGHTCLQGDRGFGGQQMSWCVRCRV